MRNIVIEQTGSDDFLNRIGMMIEEKLKTFYLTSSKKKRRKNY